VSLGQVTDGGQRRSLTGARNTVQSDYLIATSEDVLDRRALAFIQVRMLASQSFGRVAGTESLVSALADVHPGDGATFKIDHLLGGKGTTGPVRRLLDAHQFAGLAPSVELNTHFTQRDVPHAPRERITDDGTLIHDGFALQVSIHRKRNRTGWCDPMAALMVVGHPFLRGRNDAIGLVAVLTGHLLVSSLHLVMGEFKLGLAGLVRSDLSRGGAAETTFIEVLLNLLTPRTGCSEIRLGVAVDFRLAALAAVNLVAQVFQSHSEFRAIYGSAELLRLVDLTRLERPNVTVVGSW
jgi:hypothetical protein